MSNNRYTAEIVGQDICTYENVCLSNFGWSWK